MKSFNEHQEEVQIPSRVIHHSEHLTPVPENAALKNDLPSGKNVVVGIDARKESVAALEWILGHETVHPGDTVFLLHVRPHTKHLRIHEGTGGEQDAYTLFVENKLDALVKVMREKYMVHCVPVLRSGDPREVILNEVKVRDADLLVTGARCLGTLRKHFVTSVSSYCEKHADCPVMVVKLEGKKH